MRGIDDHLPNGLCCIDMKSHAAFPADFTNGANRLNDSCFVVDPHDGDQADFAPALLEQIPQRLEVDQSVLINCEPDDIATAVAELLSKLAHRAVLEFVGDENRPARLIHKRAEHREICGLCSAGGEDELAVAAANEP